MASDAVPTSPPLSVLMCVHNGSDFLAEAVDSILQQSFRDFEFIIVDDGSTDGTHAMLEQYAKQDPRIRVLTQSRCLGVGASLQAGLALVRSPLVARMDADDVSLPERLRLQAEFMTAHPQVDVLGTAVEVFTTEERGTSATAADNAAFTAAISPGHVEAATSTAAAAVPATSATPTNAPPRPAASRLIVHPCTPALVSWSLSFFCPLAHPSVMFRTAAVRQAGGYAPAWGPVEDLELWQRMSRVRGGRLANLPQLLLRLRKHTKNVSAAASRTADAPASASSTFLPACALRSSALQQWYALLATQQHVVSLIRAPVSIELVYGLISPSTALVSLAHVGAAFALLQSLETSVLRLEGGSPVNDTVRSAIQKDVSARMGELVMLATRLEGEQKSAPAQRETANPVSDSSDNAGSGSPTVALLSPLEALHRAATAAAAPRAAPSSPSFALVPSASVAAAAAAPSAAVSSASLWRAWMSRGADATTLLAQLLRK